VHARHATAIAIGRLNVGDHHLIETEVGKHLFRFHPERLFLLRRVDLRQPDPDEFIVGSENLAGVAVVNGEFTVKSLYKRNGKIRLVRENKAYAVIEVTAGMDVEIWGVVSHNIHKTT
jgi:hypothetical protein